MIFTSTTQNAHCRVFLVTGATGAIGKAIAAQLAKINDSEVVLVARNATKARQIIEEIVYQSGNPRLRFEQADLSRRDDILKLAGRWTGPLHVLINNAACAPRIRQNTPEGIEMQFAVNVLAYFWLTRAFINILQASAPARIVNVASYWAGGLDLNDLEFVHRRYDNDLAYRQSKQADRMLSVAFSERLQSFNISVNACHPGDVHSALSHDLGFGGHETPDQGADTPVWLATHPSIEQTTGCYFEHRRATRCSYGQDKQSVYALYEKCKTYSTRK